LNPMPLSAIPAASGARHVVFYDGVCNMCNSSVKLLLRLDRRGILCFAPLQGSTADALRDRGLLEPVSADAIEGNEDGFLSVLFVANEGSSAVRVYRKSQAVLQILRHIGGPWKAVSLLRVVPAVLLDPFYTFVASNRYRWFGKRPASACALPNPAEAARFLP